MKKVIAGELVLIVLNMVVVFLYAEHVQKNLQAYGDKILLAALECRRSAELAKENNRRDFEKLLSAIETENPDTISSVISELNTAIQRILDKKDAVETVKPEINQTAANNTVENDYKKQQLMETGIDRYTRKEYGKAVQAFNLILNHDHGNQRALVYYNASLFYLNPGDESKFSKIARSLEPLRGSNKLGGEGKRTILKVLAGISREKGDAEAAKKYSDLLKKMEGDI